MLNMYNLLLNIYLNSVQPLPPIDFPSATGVLDLVVFSFLSAVPSRLCTCPTHSNFLMGTSEPYGSSFATELNEELSPSPRYSVYLRLFFLYGAFVDSLYSCWIHRCCWTLIVSLTCMISYKCLIRNRISIAKS